MTRFKILLCLLFVSIAFGVDAQQPIPGSITYQGSLQQSGQPAEGGHDLSFQLYDGPDAGSGSAVGAPVVIDDVDVTDGVFSVQLDFGPGAFDNEARWLEIGVRDGGSTGSYTVLSPFSPITPAPQAQFALNAQQAASADQASNADQADNASQLGGMPAGDFSLDGHAHATLSAGDGLAGSNYDGTGAATFNIGAGDGISVAPDQVSTRVDGSTIGFNPGGELTMLPSGPNYGEVATVAKSGGDYTDPVAAMNDRASWCSETVVCLLRIMPGIYDLNAALELHPFVTVVGVGNQLGQTAILRRDDTEFNSGVVDASGCGFNGCKMGNLTIATATTDSMKQSRAIHSEGGRLDLWRVFVVATSDHVTVYGLVTDSNVTIDNSEFFVQGDIGYAVSTSGGGATITDSRFRVQTSAFRATAIRTFNTSLTMARNFITASGATRAIAVEVNDGLLQDRHSRMIVSGTDRSRALVVNDCVSATASLVGTEIVSNAATETTGIDVVNCPQFEAREISVSANGSTAVAIHLEETPFTLAHSRIESDNDTMTVSFSLDDTNSYPVRIAHSQLTAPDVLTLELGPYDDTAVAFSRLENGRVFGAVTCTNNVDENFADLGNTCP